MSVTSNEFYRENIILNFRLKNFRLKQEISLDFYNIKKIKQNALINNKHKNVFTDLNYIKHSHISASVVTEFVSSFLLHH